MAQNIVKTIKTDREPKQFKFGLDRLPEVKQTSRQPKILKDSDKEKQRARAGKVQGGINLKGKPKIIEHGKKLK